MPQPKLVHFTEGGIWHGHFNQDFTSEWRAELESLLCGANPCARGIVDATPELISFEVTYEQTK